MIHFEGTQYKYNIPRVEPVVLGEYDYRKSNGVWNYGDIDNISLDISAASQHRRL